MPFHFPGYEREIFCVIGMLHTQILLQTKVMPQTGTRNTVFLEGQV